MLEADADKMLADAETAIDTKMSLDDMIEFATHEAYLIWGQQRARLIGDMLWEPLPEQVARLHKWTAIRNFIEKCKHEPAVMARWLNSRARRD